MKKSGPQESKSPSQLIDARIKELGDWRGEMLNRLRAVVKKADPEIIEEWEWGGGPGWAHAGLVFTRETFKKGGQMNLAERGGLSGPSGAFQPQPWGEKKGAP